MRYQPPFALPNEFALAAACCRWAISGEGAEAIGQSARTADWGAFLGACRRHRVQGLAWRAMSELRAGMPAPIQVALSGDARRVAEQGLRMAAESRRLAEAFAGAGVPILFLKGLALGKLAYGDPFLKMGCDVDVLVAPENVGRAASLLAGLGYELAIPRHAGALARWHRSRKESVWTNAAGQVLDLHSRVADQPQLLPGITVDSPRQTVTVAPGIALPALADEELFAHLCVHGASSAWFRLKWIADLAGMLQGRTPESIERLYDRASELGAGRAPAQALILAQWLFDLSVSDGLANRIATPAARWLAHAALGEMLRGEPTERPFGTAMIHLTQFLLLPAWRYKVTEFGRQARAGLGLI